MIEKKTSGSPVLVTNLWSGLCLELVHKMKIKLWLDFQGPHDANLFFMVIKMGGVY